VSHPADWTVGYWNRFDRYEIRDGFIRAAAGATLTTYNPWEEYRADRGTPPYDGLLVLLEEIQREVTFSTTARGRPFLVSPRAERALLAWCARYGVLGVLLHQAHAVTLHARWRPPASVTAPRPDDVLLPSVRRYVRTSTRWRAVTRMIMAQDGVYMTGEPERAETPLARAEYFPSLPAPGVLLRDMVTDEWLEEPLDRTWALYFPDVPEAERPTFDYPVPMSEPFWRLYAEPVDQFVHGAVVLRDALLGLERLRPLDEASDEDKRLMGRGLSTLEGLVAGVSPTLTLHEDGTVAPQWAAPSLLSSFAMMAYLDVTGSRRHLVRCEACDRVFFSEAWQARYCSERCRNRAQKRAYRKAHPRSSK
jgi:hypothetical protein